MKKLLFVPLLCILIFCASVVWFYQAAQPVSSNKEFTDFLITKGSSGASVGAKLQKAGLIKNALAFKLYIQFAGLSSKIQTGEFRLSPSFTLFEVVDQLQRGPVELWVTIPEGLRREEIANKFMTGLSKDNLFTAQFLELTKDSEGMLFPDTYLFSKEATAGAIVKKMTSTYMAKIANLTPKNNMSTDELLVLASLIERETKKGDERPVVAGIILKRIEAGWPLQIDAAVQYAVGTQKNWWPILTREDLNSNSKYNTYKYQGLPPGPISNPGITALQAAYNPVESDYWYYIHDPQGVIHYGRTLEEHNQNISKYLGK